MSGLSVFEEKSRATKIVDLGWQCAGDGTKEVRGKARFYEVLYL